MINSFECKLAIEGRSVFAQVNLLIKKTIGYKKPDNFLKSGLFC